MKYKKRNWLLLKLVNADEKFLSVGKELELLGVGKVSWRSEERRVGKECRSRWSPYH